MSRIFVDRPIFAWVIAIVVMLAGVGAILTLPVEQFPDIAPPQVNISALYPGASAETLETSVTQVIEQQITGVDGLLYFSANSSSQGQVRITATFAKGTNPDIAQVQVQNKVQQALSRLPQIVQAQGITVTKSNPDQLMVVGLYDESDRVSATDLSDFVASHIQDVLARIPGVGQVDSFGAQYAMRVWLDPNRLAAYSLIPGDVVAAIAAQNAEVAAGEIGGQPSPPGQMLNAIVTAQSRLTTADQFRRIVVKTRPDGSTVLLSDVARVELGSENYTSLSDLNHHPATGIGIPLTPGADALKTANGPAGNPVSAGLPGDLSQRFDPVHQEVDRGRGNHPGRGNRPRRHRHLRLSAKLAGHADPGHRGAGGAARHVRRLRPGRLLDQHPDPVRHGARHRPAGR
jgi:multidrug efflux pump